MTRGACTQCNIPLQRRSTAGSIFERSAEAGREVKKQEIFSVPLVRSPLFRIKQRKTERRCADLSCFRW
jgi:hypothetical protein